MGRITLNIDDITIHPLDRVSVQQDRDEVTERMKGAISKPAYLESMLLNAKFWSIFIRNAHSRAWGIPSPASPGQPVDPLPMNMENVFMSELRFFTLGLPSNPLLVILHRTLPPGYSDGPGVSPRWTLNLTIAGAWESMTPGQPPIRYGTGELSLIRPNMRKRYQVVSDRPWEYVQCSFVPRPHWDPWLEFPEVQPGFTRLPLADSRVFQDVRRSLLRVHQMVSTALPEDTDLIFNALERVILICRHHTHRVHHAPRDSRVDAAVSYLMAHLRDHVNLKDVAHTAHVSPNHLVVLFKRQMGITPLAFQQRQRILRARQLLALSDERVGQIAYEVGFTDPLYFSNCFRKHMGLSPRAYRTQHRTEV